MSFLLCGIAVFVELTVLRCIHLFKPITVAKLTSAKIEMVKMTSATSKVGKNWQISAYPEKMGFSSLRN